MEPRQKEFSMSLSQPKSWFAFLLLAALGSLLFLPMALIGMAYERIPFFLAGLTGAGILWIVAAAMGLRLASGIIEGRYRDLQPMPWRQQVW
jgi:hypothetical protein